MPASTELDPRVVRTRRHVLAAARTVLVEEGWQRVTVTRVADRSGYARTDDVATGEHLEEWWNDPLVFDQASAVMARGDVMIMAREGKPVPFLLGKQHALFDKLVFSKIRDRFGGRVRFFISGAAALNRDVAEWFHVAGILVLTDGSATDVPDEQAKWSGLPPVYPVAIGAVDEQADVSVAHVAVRFVMIAAKLFGNVIRHQAHDRRDHRVRHPHDGGPDR